MYQIMKIQKKTKTLLFATLIPVAITLIFLLSYQSNFLKNLELRSLDSRFQYSTHMTKANKDVVVVLIDEASLQSMEPLVGRWPWPRSLYGELLEFFQNAGARAVLFDILFTEPQTPRNEKGELGEADKTLIMSTASSGNTFHAMQIVNDLEDEVNKKIINKPMPIEFTKLFATSNIKSTANLPKFNNYYLPITELWKNSYSVGVVEFDPDSDGIYRSTHLFRPYQNNFFPVLALAQYLKNNNTQSILLNNRFAELDSLKIPLLADGKYLINMKKDITNFSIGGIFSSIQKINQGTLDNLIVNPSEFKNKIVIIGASAVGVEDLKMTSVGKNVPGVYLHASIISNLIDRDFIQQVSPKSIFLILLIVNITMGILVMQGSNLTYPLLLFFLSFSGYIGLSFYQFDHSRLWFLLISPLFALSINLLLLYIVKSFTEGREKKFLKAAFSNYISPELIDIMYQSGEAPKLGGDVGQRTAYFTDIQGFSTFSEQLSAPRLVELLNEYLTVMTDILVEEHGTLDKYEGDAIIAFFGAPMPLADHAERAIRTALRMQEALGTLREKWTSEGDKWPVIVHQMRMRIGINTGEIVTGNMGSKMRMNYTMMGDAVNLAARLEESAKQYGVFTQISHFTYNEVKDKFVFRELDTIRVVGKSEPITTYEPLMAIEQKDTVLLKIQEIFSLGLSCYKAQKWDEAIAYFNESLKYEYERYPTLTKKPNPSKIYIERCEEFKISPPPNNWDGVYNLTHK